MILLPNQRPHGKEKLSICRWCLLLYWRNSLKIHFTCYWHWDHLFLLPPVPTLNFWSFQDRSKNFPRTIRTYRNVESRATSVISAKCGSPVKPVQEGRNGPVHLMPNLICLTLNSSTNKILILTFPGGFQAEGWGVGHTAPHIRTVFAAGKSRRQILRENCSSSAQKILSRLWTFYCCSGFTTQSQKYSLGFKKRSITNGERKNINHILQQALKRKRENQISSLPIYNTRKSGQYFLLIPDEIQFC